MHPSFVVGLVLPDISGYATGTDKPWYSYAFYGQDPADVKIFA